MVANQLLSDARHGDFGRHGFGCGSRARLARAALGASTGVRHSGTVFGRGLGFNSKQDVLFVLLGVSWH